MNEAEKLTPPIRVMDSHVKAPIGNIKDAGTTFFSRTIQMAARDQTTLSIAKARTGTSGQHAARVAALVRENEAALF